MNYIRWYILTHSRGTSVSIAAFARTWVEIFPNLQTCEKEVEVRQTLSRKYDTKIKLQAQKIFPMRDEAINGS